MKYFSRLPLALQLVETLQGKTSFSDAPNGLFLTAPRRTGKSTFLQIDLKSALEKKGIVVVYVDLWADQKRSPGHLIADAVSRTPLNLHQEFLAKTGKAARHDRTMVRPRTDSSIADKTHDFTLTDALRALHEAAQAPIALIVDEAQHALTSLEGENAMTALKSARDQLNRPGEVNLMIVMSGSDRDKLLRLVNVNTTPFYGSQVQRMPELGADFIAHATQSITAQYPHLNNVNQAILLQAFSLFGHRPQFFINALGQVLNAQSYQGEGFESSLLEYARQQRQDDEALMESYYLALKPLEQVILWRLLAQGSRFRPYDAEALTFYNTKINDRVTVSRVQKTLEGMRERQPSLLWKSVRGEYAVDNIAMHHWYQQRLASNTWPPIGQQLDWNED